jgi:membrane fusion protein, multidrug efflux system
MTNRRKRWVLAATALVVLAGAAAGGLALRGSGNSEAEAKSKKAEQPLEFASADVVKLEPHALAVQLVMPGSVQPVAQATVRSKLSAEVQRVLAREGDRVAAGQVLVELDTAQLRQQLAERQATLESARARLAQEERTRQTSAQLVKQNFISKNASDAADDAWRAQSAQVEAASAQLAQTRLLLDDAVVRAPIAGQIARRHVQAGEKVSFDAPLMQVVDLTRLEVQAQAPVAEVARLPAGGTAEVEVEGITGKRYAGRIDRINPAAEPGSRLISVYVTLTNEDALLRGGMFARVHVNLAALQPRPSLPATALMGERGNHWVWVIADGKLARRTVSVGLRDERAARIEILDGLKPDDAVLGSRFDSLREGRLARVVSGGTGTSVATGTSSSTVR